MRKLGSKILLAVSVGMIALPAYAGVQLIGEYWAARESYEKAAEHYVSEPPQEPQPQGAGEPAGKKKEREPPKAPITVDFDALRGTNPDVAGWLYIESIGLSYPVMQGADNEYYLTHTWDRQEIFAASIFLDYRNHPDFKDYNTIIYGHNMKDGTMFHDIQYCMEPGHYAKSPYIWVLTPEGDYQYEIFTEYDTRYDSDTYTLFDGPGENLAGYIRKVQQQSLWKSEVKMGEAEHILTLSTCNGAHDERRIVQGKRVKG